MTVPVRSLADQRKKKQLTASEQILLEKVIDLERDLSDLRAAFSTFLHNIHKLGISTTQDSLGDLSATPHDKCDKQQPQ